MLAINASPSPSGYLSPKLNEFISLGVFGDNCLTGQCYFGSDSVNSSNPTANLSFDFGDWGGSKLTRGLDTYGAGVFFANEFTDRKHYNPYGGNQIKVYMGSGNNDTQYSHVRTPFLYELKAGLQVGERIMFPYYFNNYRSSSLTTGYIDADATFILVRRNGTTVTIGNVEILDQYDLAAQPSTSQIVQGFAEGSFTPQTTQEGDMLMIEFDLEINGLSGNSSTLYTLMSLGYPPDNGGATIDTQLSFKPIIISCTK